VTEEDETGDWIVYGHYMIDSEEPVVGLTRTINVLPGDLTQDEPYVIEGGKAKKQTSKSRSWLHSES